MRRNGCASLHFCSMAFKRPFGLAVSPRNAGIRRQNAQNWSPRVRQRQSIAAHTGPNLRIAYLLPRPLSPLHCFQLQAGRQRCLRAVAGGGRRFVKHESLIRCLQLLVPIQYIPICNSARIASKYSPSTTFHAVVCPRHAHPRTQMRKQQWRPLWIGDCVAGVKQKNPSPPLLASPVLRGKQKAPTQREPVRRQ
jgi:hypothetical protein